MLDDIEETKINLNDLKAPNFKIKIRLKDVYSSIWKINRNKYDKKYINYKKIK